MSATCVGIIGAPLALKARAAAKGGARCARRARPRESLRGEWREWQSRFCRARGASPHRARRPLPHHRREPLIHPRSFATSSADPRPHVPNPVATPQAAPAALWAQASAAAESTEVQNAAIAAHQALWDLGVADDPLNPDQAKEIAGILGPVFSVSTLLFIIRIVMTWYPSVPVSRMPWVIAYLPTEPLLKPTRSLVPPVGGVDVSPIIWVGMISFMNEILLGKQGLLVLLSQKQVL